MQRIIPVLVAVALTACGGEGTSDGTSGIRGQALAGPQCAVEMAESPCPDLPWEGTVVATNTASGEEFTATTDADGHFELILAPGTYEVSIAVSSSPPSVEPQTVMVDSGVFAAVDLFVDTGIR